MNKRYSIGQKVSVAAVGTGVVEVIKPRTRNGYQTGWTYYVRVGRSLLPII